MMDARSELDQIRQRAEKATDGPWHAITTGRAGGDHWHVTDDGESIAYIHASDGEDEDRRQPDAEFIAASRSDVPRLVAALTAVLDLADRIDASAAGWRDLSIELADEGHDNKSAAPAGRADSLSNAARSIRKAITDHLTNGDDR